MNTLRKTVFRATLIVCNKNLYQISAHVLKIKSQQILQIINSAKIVLIVHLHQAHHTQTTVVPEK
jgi:predicted metallo-beta-lactamase superfamily hydrolase